MQLDKLLRPERTAIVGASEKEGFGGDTCRNVLSYADPDKVYFINPKRAEVLGRKSWPSLESLPENIDQVVICTPQETVEGLLREAAAKGAKSAVVYASGYKETGTPEGEQAEENLVTLCKKLGMTLMGPNCAGFLNFNDRIASFAFIGEVRDRRGGVGFISQSGQLCLSAMDTPNMRMSYAISGGNCSVSTMEDYLEYLVDDPGTSVVAMYLEGVKNPVKLIASLKKAASMHKPVVVLKIGRSVKGSVTAASHTGSLSGADASIDAVFKKFGVIRVDDLQELLSTSLTLATWKELPKSTGVASMSLSGGETGICADVGEGAGIVYPDFTEETLSSLREQLPSYSTPRNPLDMTASLSYEAEKFARALRTVMDDPNVGMVIIGYTLLFEITDPAIHYMASGMEQVVKAGGNLKPVVVMPFAENSRNPEYLDKLTAIGVPVLPPPVYGFKILKYIMDYVDYLQKSTTRELALPDAGPENTTPRVLTEFESMGLLKEHGIPVPAGGLARDVASAVDMARDMGLGLGSSPGGKKAVLKISSADIPHKTDAGGVRLNLETQEQVAEAFGSIMASCRAHKPDAKLDGVFVQEMLPKGLEVIIGVNTDPQFGPQVLCGLGGIFVEIFNDTALYPAPMSKAEAMGMLKSLKAYPLLAGYRGSSPLDLDALAEAIVAVGDFAVAHNKAGMPRLIELDINPMFVYEKGVRAADALVVLKS